MQYLGGKSKISKEISEVINEVFGREKSDCEGYSGGNRERERERELTTFVSLFCGSCAVESKINAKQKILNDKHEYLIEMWKALQNGYVLPTIITEDDYKYVKTHKDENRALTGIVGFGCSFGGKWFGGLARNKKGDNYCSRAERSVLKDLVGVKDAIFSCKDYRDVVIPDGSVVYCDPPYANTTGYTTGTFNTEEFWEYMRTISKKNKVFISEENAPSDFICVWQKDFTRMLDVNKENIFVKTEKLWTYNG